MPIQNNIRKYQTLFNVLSGILAMIVQIATNFFLTQYIVGTLGEVANGFTQLANNFVTYASLITIAFNSMAGRFISVSYHRGEKDKVQAYYSSTIACNLIVSAVLIPLAVFLILHLNHVIVVGNADLYDVQTLFTCVFLNFEANLAVSVYSINLFVNNRIYLQNIINLFRNVLNAILLLCMFAILPAKMYYVSLAATIWTFVSIPVYRLLQTYYMKELKFAVKNFRVSAIKDLIRSGIWNTVNQCGHMLMTGLDLLLCDLFISPAAMGVLSVAKTIPNAIISLANILNSSFAPELTIDWAKGNQKEIMKQLRNSMMVSSIIVSIPIMTFCSFSVPFYTLWMPTLNAKTLAELSFLTCMAFIPWAGPQTLYNVFTATNHLKANSIAFCSTGIMNIGIVYLLLRYTEIGVYAVAGVSSSLSIIRNMVFTAPYTAKLLGLKWYTFYPDVTISLMCCFINAGIAFFVSKFIPAIGWINLIFAVICTCILTLIIDLLFVLNKEQRSKLLNKVIRKQN